MTIEVVDQKAPPIMILTYSKGYRRLHWLMALTILMLLIAGQQFNFDLSVEERLRGLTLHSSIGSASFLIIVLLIVKRFIKRDVIPEPGLSLMKLLAARAVQFSLYLVALLIPMTGMFSAFFSPNDVMVFGLINVSLATGDHDSSFTAIRALHRLATQAAMLLVLCHAGAALYHHFVVRDNVLKSMLVISPSIRKLLNHFGQ